MARDPSLANESSATRMRAVLFDSYGEPDQLYEDSTSVPGRLPGSVVIRVRAAGVNPIDARLREGEGRWILPGRFPRIPGYDVAGEVVDGDRSAKLRKGDRVMAFLTNPYGGGYAQFARCAIDGVARIPDWLSFEEAAATPLAATTALQGLRDHGALKPGDRVLINGASGGVGVFAIQIAKA
jgi:NADPH2:quinone reductase